MREIFTTEDIKYFSGHFNSVAYNYKNHSSNIRLGKIFLFNIVNEAVIDILVARYASEYNRAFVILLCYTEENLPEDNARINNLINHFACKIKRYKIDDFDSLEHYDLELFIENDHPSLDQEIPLSGYDKKIEIIDHSIEVIE
jgi:hypothetical protein